MTDRRPFIKERLFCPGPTPVSNEAKIASLDASAYHRTQSFYDMFLRCRKMLAPIMGTKSLPLILTSSGTGAMEAALVNLTNEGDEVLTARAGKFGERWGKIANAYKCKGHTLEVKWGETPKGDDFKNYLAKHTQIKAVFLQANETSTGVVFPLDEIVSAIKEVSSCLIIIDAISALGAHKISMDELGVDCIVSGSQKGFGIPPGLSFIALSDRGWKSISSRPRFYFDLEIEEKGQKKGITAWTPATSLVASLEVSLNTLHKIGLSEVIDHHEKMAKAVRSGVQNFGLELLAQSSYSNALTAIKLPDHIDGGALIARLKNKYGAVFSGGQDQLKGKIIRFAHLGFSDRFDVISGMAALEFALKEEGFDGKLGSGVSALMKSLL